MNRYIYFLIVFLACAYWFFPKLVHSQSPSLNGNCVFCLQAVPKCKPTQKLIPQTCEKCAHCIDIEQLDTNDKSAFSRCKNQCGPICCLEYEKCLVMDDPKDGIADFKCTPLYSSSGLVSEECKCQDGFRWTGSECQEKATEEFCTSNFSPVCGCDGQTYSNSCVAMQNGIKIFTKDKCSEFMSCKIDDDCPSGICEDGSSYQKYSCLENKCRKLFFEHDPCDMTTRSKNDQGSDTNCCSAETRISTNEIDKLISNIMVGDFVLSDDKEVVRVKKIKEEKSKKQQILHITLNDATILEISPNHPTADGKKFKDLKIGDRVDGKMVVESKIVPYKYKYTYDILPDSETGNYYANGTLIGSTLK